MSLLKELIEEIKNEMDKCGCDRCEGSGVEWNPVWREWTEARDAAGFKDSWYTGREPDYDKWLKKNPMPDEQEELECSECEGTGIAIHQSELLYDLTFLMTNLRTRKWNIRVTK